MNSHQKVVLSHTVAKPKVRPAAARAVGVRNSATTKAAWASSCSHHSVAPRLKNASKGHAAPVDCAQAAINTIANQIRDPGAAGALAKRKAPVVTPIRCQ